MSLVIVLFALRGVLEKVTIDTCVLCDPDVTSGVRSGDGESRFCDRGGEIGILRFMGPSARRPRKIHQPSFADVWSRAA